MPYPVRTVALALLAGYARSASAIELTIEGTLDHKSTITFEVTGAAPGQNVYVVAGRGGGPRLCPPALRPLCLKPGSPVLVASGQANGSGSWSTSLIVPRTAEGAAYEFQAVASGAGLAPSGSYSAFTHNPYSTVAKPTGLGSATPIQSGSVRQAVAGGVLEGSHYIGFENADHVPICRGRADAFATFAPGLACPNCEFALTITFSGVEEESWRYSRCQDLLGINVADLYPSSMTLGFVGNLNTYSSTNYALLYEPGVGWSHYGHAYAGLSYQGPGQTGPRRLGFAWYGVVNGPAPY